MSRGGGASAEACEVPCGHGHGKSMRSSGLSLFPLEQVNSLTAESSATSHCTALLLGVMVARSLIGCIQGGR